MSDETNDKLPAIVKGTETVVTWTKGNRLTQTLADSKARALLTKTLATFVGVDMHFSSGMKSMGEMCVNILDQDEKTQREMIAAICEMNGVPVIEEIGRSGLAKALFANFPEMLKIDPTSKNKDTPGGKRITSYMASYNQVYYKQLAGDVKGKKSRRAATPPDGGIRTARDLWQKFISNASATELSTIQAVCLRAKVDFEKWQTAPAAKKPRKKKK